MPNARLPSTSQIAQRRRGAALTFALCLLLSSALLASDLAPTTARFRSLNTSNGLSQDTALALAQDRHGFLWVGTQDGLNRYDGHEVITFRAGRDSDSLGSSWIDSLCLDPRNRLWVGTSAGLFRYHDGDQRFQRYSDSRHPASRDQFIYDLICNDDDSVWVAGSEGLGRIDDASHSLMLVEEQTPPEDRRSRALAVDLQGRLWVGGFNGLRCVDPARTPLGACGEVDLLRGKPVNALLIDPQGALWVGTDRSGLFRVDTASAQAEAVFADDPQDPFRGRVVALHWDPPTGLWLGTELGAYRVLDHSTATPRLQPFLHRPYDPFSAGLGRVRSFLSSEDGSLWFGTWEGGASRLHPRYRRLLSFAGESLGLDTHWQPAVYSLIEHREQLWIGTPQGAYQVDLDRFALHPAQGSEARAVHSMASDGQTLWLGTDDGLYSHSETDSFRSSEALPALRRSRIARLAVDGQRLWAVAALQGVYVIDTQNSQILARTEFAGTVNHIGILNPSFVLVSASDGLYWFDRHSFALRHRTEVDTSGVSGKLPGRPSGFLVDGAGRVWISAYGSGLVELQLAASGEPAEAELKLVAGRDQLNNLGINSVQGDAQGRLWLASDRGIIQFDPQSGQTRHFDASDGALARGYYFAARQHLSNGWLAFGSKHGFTVFDPLQNLSPMQPRPPLVTSLERQGQTVLPRAQQADSPLPAAIHLLDTLRLPPGWGRNLLFKLASPSFVHPQELHYRYRLQGFDNEWLEVDAQRRLVAYTNLAPGEYQLQLQALARGGLASDVHTLQMIIEPLWWQSTAARVLAALLTIGLLGLLYRARMHQLALQRGQLERLVRERTESLQRAREQAEQSLQVLQSTQVELVRAEKLSALGQLVAGVAHEVNTPLGVAVTAISHMNQQLRALQDKVQSGRMTKRDFEQQIGETIGGGDLVERNLDRAADLIRSFKQVSVDRSSDQRRKFDLDELLNQLLQSLKILWRHRPIEMQINCPQDLILDSFPGALGQVLTNLTQNALLHAFQPEQAGRLQIECRPLQHGWVEIRFSDDGRGIAAEHMGKIFEPFFTTRRNEGGTGLGLHIVHNLVRDVLGGKLQVRSEVGQGTEIRIELPQVAPK
ncbi:two-component regulator propeller domain-containing protein [Pseudomarimonas arenosa]|uniref:histidine kinase n=1 Tax=Pseudomarimonas arenosa TaxID=2774145 RepID=A0AAW3ZK79_9GAMM|nr:two-component regulator propeller domain-containing protein [Pseudomarimonas arenosa]MBD8525609.1 hypothetical protein [Pseudomarimonas arenosa]